MKSTVFVHTNARQRLGAIVAAHALKRNSRRPDAFDVRIIEQSNYPFFQRHEGDTFIRGGHRRVWRNDDLQSFTPLRFMVPELAGFQGRAVVIDPDVFALGDIDGLLTRDMQGKALLCCYRPPEQGRPGYWVSSVMLLDCARLRHWRCEEQFAELFTGRRDYAAWMALETEPRGTIGRLEDSWNDFDHLDGRTKLLHNTRRTTQPWKTGLPIDFTMRGDRWSRRVPGQWLRSARRAVFGSPGVTDIYKPHPDPRQQALFFTLLRECLESGLVDEAFLRREMQRNHLRPDALELLAEDHRSIAEAS